LTDDVTFYEEVNMANSLQRHSVGASQYTSCILFTASTDSCADVGGQLSEISSLCLQSSVHHVTRQSGLRVTTSFRWRLHVLPPAFCHLPSDRRCRCIRPEALTQTF